MNEEVLKRFLNGEANEDEARQCETLLESLQTVVDEQQLNASDSLVTAIRAGNATGVDDVAGTDKLLLRIEQAVVRQSVDREELVRLLDPPLQPDELGRIGKYRIIEFMAAGGMGLVFKAEDTELNRLVCLKLLHPALAMKQDAKLRFERESRAAAQLRSERIVTLLDVGFQKDLPYLVMQLLDGESLRTRLARDGKLSPELACRYLTQIAEGLRHAHASGIVHRDIKPDNIWITTENDIKLLDFGLARPLDEVGNLTTSGGLIGTPQYMSPEQVRGQALDGRSDLFSVGAVLFEMLTGSPPFQRNNLFSTMVAITNDSIQMPPTQLPSELSVHLEAILHDLLKKDAKDRIPTAQALLERLNNSSNFTTVSSPIASCSPDQSATRVRQNRAPGMRYLLAGCAIGLCSMLLGILIVQTTDKGTLIVRTKDAKVRVLVEQEKVTIRDLMSGKRFDVQIGKTSLPSGVYQLDVSDKQSGLTFSSSTVAIRRGESVIVEVEFKSTPDFAGDLSAKSDELKSTIDMTEPNVDQEKNADASYDSNARTSFADVLKSLPPQAVEKYSAAIPINRKGKLPLSQPQIPGIDSWSVEADSQIGPEPIRNCDDTLYAACAGNAVQIWNTDLKLQYILPTPQHAAKAIFDNKYPNLIAVSYFNKEYSELLDPKVCNCEIAVWRLGDRYAEIIHRIPTSRYDFAWDQGYRLFHHLPESWSTFRLDQGTSYNFQGPDGSLLQNAVSTSGRYLATQNQRNINIWDLEKAEFAFAEVGVSRIQWSKHDEQVAFFKDKSYEILTWNLVNRQKQLNVTIPGMSYSQDRPPVLAFSLEPSFQRLAWVTRNGTLGVCNPKTNAEHALQIANQNEIRAATIHWEEDSFVVETDLSAFRWSPENSEVQGSLTKRSPSQLISRQLGERLDITRALGSNNPLLFWKNASAISRNSQLMKNNPQSSRNREVELCFDAFNVESNKFVRESPLGQTQMANRHLYLSGMTEVFGPPYCSPYGKYALGPLTNPTDQITNRNTSLFYSFSSSDLPQRLDKVGATAVWDKSERYALLMGGIIQETTRPFIFDADKKELIDDRKFSQASLKLRNVFPASNGFVIITEKGKKSTTSQRYSVELEAWFVDPVAVQMKELQTVTRLLSKLRPIDSIVVTDQYAFVSSLGVINAVEDPAKSIHFYRIALDESAGSDVQRVTIPVQDELRFSASGEFFARKANDAEVVWGNTTTGNTRSLRTKGPSDLMVARWNDVAQSIGAIESLEDQTQSQQPSSVSNTSFQGKVLASSRAGQFPWCEWHPNADIFGWILSSYPEFFDARESKWSSHPDVSLGGTASLTTTAKGWTRTSFNEILYFDLSGNYVGRLVFDSYMADAKPSNPRWILRDGTVASQCRTEGLYLSYLMGNQYYCDALADFERTRPDTKSLLTHPTFQKPE